MLRSLSHFTTIALRTGKRGITSSHVPFLDKGRQADNNQNFLFLSNPTTQKRSRNTPQPNTFCRTLSTRVSQNDSLNRISRRRNFRIMHLGQKGNWGAISALYWQERMDFTIVNLVTMLYQLSTLKGLDFKNDRIEKLLLDAAKMIENSAKKGESIDDRQRKTLQKSLKEMELSPTVAEQWELVLSNSNSNSNTNTVPDGMAVAKEINRRLLELGKNGDWKRIFMMHYNEKAQFNSVNYATALTLLAKCGTLQKDNPHLNEFVTTIAKQLWVDNSWWDSRGMVNVVHALAKMKLDTASANDVIASILRKDNLARIMESGNAQDISNLAWSCATMDIRSSDLFQAINQQGPKLVETGSPQAIANTAWACATLGMKCPMLFTAIEQSPNAFVHDATTQHLANTAWACGTLGIQCPKFFDAIDEKANELVLEGKTQEISNTAWAFASTGFPGQKLFQAIESKASDFVTQAKTQEIANLAWACATLEIQCPKLFEAIDQNAFRFGQNQDVQPIVNTVWSFATLDVPCPSMLQIIDVNSKRIVDNGTTQEISNTLWSIVKLGHDSLAIFSSIEQRLNWLFEKGSTQELSNIIWAYGQSGLHSPALRRMIDSHASAILLSKDENNVVDTQSAANTSHALAQLDYFSKNFFELLRYQTDAIIKNGNGLHISNICYAFAILDLPLEYESDFRKLWDRAISLDPGTLDHGMRIQLLHTFGMVSQILDIPPPTNVLQSTTQSMVLESYQSKAQRLMSKLLNENGFCHEIEVSPFPDDSILPSGLLAIDAASKQSKIAVEFNGPRHFLRDVRTGTVLHHLKNGPTKAKRRLLERLGWTVVDIDFLEWAQLKTKTPRKKLLIEKLRVATQPRTGAYDRQLSNSTT